MLLGEHAIEVFCLYKRWDGNTLSTCENMENIVMKKEDVIDAVSCKEAKYKIT